MKRLILVVLSASLLLGGTALAGPFGVRAGITIDPDQFHFGGHYDAGFVGTNLRVVPNIEVGFGDNFTLVCLNGDLLYDFPSSPWAVGGELGINFWNRDPGIPGADNNNTDVGLSAVGNYRLALSSGQTLLLEGKLGIADSPDFKFTVGLNF
jgi:hypothetical protein